MAVVDSLEVHISAQMEQANRAIDSCVKRLGVLAQGIRAIGTNQGLSEFIKKSQSLSSEIENMGAKVSQSMKPIQEQAKKITKDVGQMVAELQNRYKDLGKGFSFAGTTEQMRRESDRLFNALEKAKVDMQRITLSDNIDSTQLEKAVSKVMELQNKYKSLQKTLEEGGRAYHENLSRITEQANRGAENLAKETEHFNSLVTGMDYGGGMEGLKNKLADYEDRLKDALQAAQDLETIGAVKTSPYTDAIAKADLYRSKVEQLKAEIESLQTGNNGLEIGEDLSGAMQQIRNMGNLISQTFADLKSGEIFRYLSESMKDFVKQAQLASGIKLPTEGYQNVLSDIERTEQALEKLEQKQRDLQAAGMGGESEEWKRAAAEIATAERQLESYIDKMHEMEAAGTDTEFSGGLANQSWIKSALAVAGEAMASLKQKIGEIPSTVSQAIGRIPVIGRIAKEAAFLGQSAFNGLKLAISSISSAAVKTVNTISTIASGIQKLTSAVKGTISRLSSMTKSFIGLKGASEGMNASLGGSLKTILKYGLGIRSLYALINKLRTAMKEGFKNLAQYSDETNASLSMLKSSLGALKNSLATAFAPIVNVIAPYLSAFIDMLTRAFNTVGRFLAALTGKSFAAQAVKNFSDYASGAGKATKAAEKLYSATLGIDELNINAGDQSSGGAGSTADEISPEDMFETVSIESDMLDFVQEIKDAWTESDFTEIGSILGTKLKNTLDGIDWEPLKETAAKIGKSIGTLINGFVETDGLADSIGRTIGEAINTGITGINAFLDSTHWDSVGTFIGEGLNGLVDTIDWEGAGHLFAAKWNAVFEVLGNIATTFDWADFGLQLATGVNTFISDFDWAENGAHLGELIKGLLDTLITFLEETDWQELGNGIADFIGGIDWGGILERLAEGVGAALGGLAALLWGLIEDAWNSVVEWWNETAYEDGQFTMEGLLNGIWEGIKDIGSWIYEHIFEPFVSGFKEAFDIHSPSGVMEEQGGFLMEGLFNGISSLVDKVVGVFTKIKDKIIEVWNTVKAKTTEIWGGIKNAIKTPINAIIGFVNGLIDGVVSGINSMTSALNNINISIPDWIPGMGGKSFGFNIPQISVPQIPYLAKGGIAMQFTPAFIGEAGAEAILPLTNSHAMSMIADSIMENADYSYSGNDADIKGMIRETVHEEVSYLVQAIAPYLGDILQNTKEMTNKEMVAVMDTREALADLRAEARNEGYVFRV